MKELTQEQKIELIKFCCEYAEGFEWERGNGIEGLRTGKFSFFHEGEISGEFPRMTTDLYKSIYYPLLLQRAIEGINKKFHNGDSDKYICQTADFIEVRCEISTANRYYDVDDFNSITQAKGKALFYIMENLKWILLRN